jgi:hypothetical protein
MIIEVIEVIIKIARAINEWILTNAMWMAFGATILLLVYYIKKISEGIKKRRPTISLLEITLQIWALLFLIFIVSMGSKLQPADWVQVILLGGLVAVTAVYANAGVKMAKETRGQLLVMNKPNIVLELIKITPEKHLIGRIVNEAGRGPAINTEIFIDHPPFKFNRVRYTWAISVGKAKGLDFHMEEPSTKVGPKIAISSTGVLVANYEDVSGNQWHSILELQWDEGFIPGHLKVGISGHYKAKPK